MNELVKGDIIINDKQIISGNFTLQHAKSGESLAYDTLDVVVHFNNEETEFFLLADDEYYYTVDDEMFVTRESASIDFESEFASGTKVTYKFDDEIIEEFYVSKLERTGKTKYRMYLVSAIGMLDNGIHFGGIYTGETLSEVLGEIFDGLTYTIDQLVADLKLYGYLPYDTKRNNLQQITIATNLAVMRNDDGSVRITALTQTNMGTISQSRVSINGSIETRTPCTAVKVVEHTYTPNGDTITLCDTSFTGIETIIFDEPAHSLVINNGTIISSSANHAVIDGNGSVLLTGEKYIHTRKEVVEGTITGDSSDNIVSVQNATLINTLNSSTIAKRLFDFYSTDTIIHEDITYGEERVGKVYSTINPYTLAYNDAFLYQMNVDMSGFLKAKASFLKGFYPQGAYSGYENKVVLTEDQTFTVPAGVDEIRVVLIGGGQGGQGGYNGTGGGTGQRGPAISYGTLDGNNPGTYSYNGEGGDGGLGGSSGTAGKVNDLGALEVTPSELFSITIGAGGIGGASNGGTGTEGGDTTFDSYSSASGLPLAGGYIDIVSGTSYALSGSNGIAGLKGRGKSNPLDTTTLSYNGTTYSYGANGNPDTELVSGTWVYGIGGNSGGSAVGSSSGTAGSGSASYNSGHGFATGGSGGGGASATITGENAPSSSYGTAGSGGHGGGGGGGGGAYRNGVGGSSYEWPGFGGGGGSGSSGGNGASGCVIIYY